jgi:hypothetical protein
MRTEPWGQVQLETNHHENRSTGVEDETDHRRHKHSPRKRRNGGTHGGNSVAHRPIAGQWP